MAAVDQRALPEQDALVQVRDVAIAAADALAHLDLAADEQQAAADRFALLVDRPAGLEVARWGDLEQARELGLGQPRGRLHAVQIGERDRHLRLTPVPSIVSFFHIFEIGRLLRRGGSFGAASGAVGCRVVRRCPVWRP